MRISNAKKEKISEQILAFLFSKTPQAIFTSKIAQEIARDEEFIKKLLLDLNSKNLVIAVTKNPKGIPYVRRIRWKLSEPVYQSYRNHQS